MDLERRDAMRVLRKQACSVPSFAQNGGMVTTSEGSTDWVVYRDALLVRAAEREHFEATIMVADAPHANDYDRFLSFDLNRTALPFYRHAGASFELFVHLRHHG